MSVNVYQFYCEYCGWKKITNGADVKHLHEIKTSPIPGGVPKFDVDTGKIVDKKVIKQARKFRCPKCGRCVTPRKLGNPQEDINQARELKARKSNEEDWAYGRESSNEGQQVQGDTSQ